MKESAFLDLAQAVQFEERTERTDRNCAFPTVWRLRQGHPGQCTLFSKTREVDKKEETPAAEIQQ